MDDLQMTASTTSSAPTRWSIFATISIFNEAAVNKNDPNRKAVTCPANIDSGKRRCKKAIKRNIVRRDIKPILLRLQELDPDHENFEQLLRDLAEVMVCRLHEKQSENIVRGWLATYAELEMRSSPNKMCLEGHSSTSPSCDGTVDDLDFSE
ncbi:hypothetical protein BU16DRAFT_49124 [Lophium mytilinum]|uniref:Uncharacterized protein n=1 Tax=Lophium mytilinum TaxID=390894 RepID=A0A6A6QS49_9PEZI|nr:hypothetical protein BU16DRAFT_49124 [Lophium mytilinum]